MDVLCGASGFRVAGAAHVSFGVLPAGFLSPFPRAAVRAGVRAGILMDQSLNPGMTTGFIFIMVSPTVSPMMASRNALERNTMATDDTYFSST